MTGVQSLWTKTTRWAPTRAMLMLHTLSLCYLRKQFEFTELVTDEVGLLIADRLRWPYDSFRTDLQQIPEGYRHIWAAGKIYAQLLQPHAYAHVDNDFLLRDPLPLDIRRSRIFIQGKDEPAYYLDPISQDLIARAGLDGGLCPFNAGIVGGADIHLMHDYCRFALGIFERLKDVPNGTMVSIVGEQAGFGQFCRDRKVRPAELIPIPNSAIREDFERCRFSHLWAWTKSESVWQAKIEERLQTEFPADYRDFCIGFPHIQACLTHPRRKHLCYQ